MNLRFQPTLERGYTKILDSSSGLKFLNEFGILVLDGSIFQDSSGENEVGIVILEGTCSVKIGEKSWENVGARGTVFGGAPSTFYVPPGFDFEIQGERGRVVIAKLPSTKKGEPQYVKPEDVLVKNVGEDNWSREVRIMLGPESFTEHLIIGETLNPPGNWSGTPPHKHDASGSETESYNEEVYYFLTDKPQGWGIERIYTTDGSLNELVFLQDGTVTIMPKGYHQVVAAPGYNLYYLWIVAGETNQLMPFEDPDHKWIKE